VRGKQVGEVSRGRKLKSSSVIGQSKSLATMERDGQWWGGVGFGSISRFHDNTHNMSSLIHTFKQRVLANPCWGISKHEWNKSFLLPTVMPDYKESPKAVSIITKEV
jgi:hypothetical protein